jgi:mannosyltransferase
VKIYQRLAKSDEAIASSLAASSNEESLVSSTKDEPKTITAIGSSLIALTPEIVVGVLALAVFGWSVGAVDPWSDELATLIVASWPVSAIMKLAEHFDLVHTVYYIAVHPVLMLDQSIKTVRLVSVVAMAATAVALVRIGRALDGWPVGLGAGLMLIASVTASRYAQEARSYALVVLLATLSTLALIRAIQTPLANRRWAIYSALLVAIGLVNIMGTLIVPAHAVWLCQSSVTRGAAVIVRWCVSIVLGGAALAPFAILALGQSGREVGWITSSPGLSDLKGIAALAWTPGREVGLFVLITVVVVGVWGTPGARIALVLGLTWGLIPPLTLWIVSQIHPLYEPRYVLFAIPGMALALGSLAGLRFAQRSSPVPDTNPNAAPPGHESVRQGWGATAAVAIVLIPTIALALAGLPQQWAQRLPDGHGENLRGVAQVLTAESRSGDGVVYLPYWVRVMKAGFPLPERVDDLTLDGDGPSTAELDGLQVTPEQAIERLGRHCRAWAVTESGGLSGEGSTDDAVAKELPARFDQTKKYAVGGFDVLLFVSRDPSCGSAR